MSMHTPGPWRIANGAQIVAGSDQIGKVWMMRKGEGKANSNLIAAAPDMLEALECVLTLQNINYGDASQTHFDLIGLCRAIQVVVNKAKGVSND